GRKEILRHVTTAAECGLKLFEGEEDFAIIVAGLIFGLDVDRSDFAAISAAIKVGSGTNVRVIEAEPGRTGREGNAAAAMRGNEGRALFGGSVHVTGNGLAVPVQLFGSVSIVDNVNRDLLAFPEAKQRAGKLVVIGGERDDLVGRNLDGNSADTKGVVGFCLSGRGLGSLGGITGLDIVAVPNSRSFRKAGYVGKEKRTGGDAGIFEEAAS